VFYVSPPTTTLSGGHPRSHFLAFVADDSTPPIRTLFPDPTPPPPPPGLPDRRFGRACRSMHESCRPRHYPLPLGSHATDLSKIAPAPKQLGQVGEDSALASRRGCHRHWAGDMGE